MGETPTDPPRSTLRTRLSLLLLLAIVFGAPALVTTSLVTQEMVGEVTRGDQPGGTLTGTIVDVDDRPVAGHTVTLWLVPLNDVARAGPTSETDAEGRFELVAPPVAGSYQLRAGGELHQLVVKGISFLDTGGATIEPRPVTMELREGAVLELEFVRPDGSPAPNGTYTFDGEQSGGGLLFGLVPYSVRGSGVIRGGRLRSDGLPPMQARLVVEFDTGETAELELRVELGLNASRIEIEPPG